MIFGVAISCFDWYSIPQGTRWRFANRLNCQPINVSVHMHRLTFCTVATLSLPFLPAVACAASPPAPVDMAQVQIGKPFPFPPANPDWVDTMGTQLGWYTFDAPNTPESPFPFPQYQVGINHNRQVVYYVRGVRPYPSMSDCFKGLRSVTTVTRAKYEVPKKELTDLHRDSYIEGVASDIKIEARCGNVGRSPYVQLTVTVMSESQRRELDTIRKKANAR
jgi:hypothetical protein